MADDWIEPPTISGTVRTIAKILWFAVAALATLILAHFVLWIVSR